MMSPVQSSPTETIRLIAKWWSIFIFVILQLLQILGRHHWMTDHIHHRSWFACFQTSCLQRICCIGTRKSMLCYVMLSLSPKQDWRIKNFLPLPIVADFTDLIINFVKLWIKFLLNYNSRSIISPRDALRAHECPKLWTSSCCGCCK